MVNDLTRWNRAGRSRFRHLGEDRTDTADDLTRWNRAGLSQAGLAERMGTTQPTIARLESGRQAPSWQTLKRFGEATGTRPEIHFVELA